MAIKLVVLGKTRERYYQDSEAEYLKRLQKFVKVDYVVLPASKNETHPEKCLEQEEQSLMQRIKETDFVVILDEHGAEFTSRAFADQVDQWIMSKPNLMFVIGGAFGFSEGVKNRANARLSLSKLTFPHNMVRTVFLEQLYRAFTILKGGHYHND